MKIIHAFNAQLSRSTNEREMGSFTRDEKRVGFNEISLFLRRASGGKSEIDITCIADKAYRSVAD